MQTDHGAVPIERINVGDKVWARNAGTGKNEMQPVTAITPQHRDQLVEVRIAGEKNPLRTTPVHPFRARRNANDPSHWIKAGDLVAGEQLETEDDRWVAVQSVTPVEGLATVYNFTVANDHDYFVGQTGFLVHNAGNCGCRPPLLPIEFGPSDLFPDSVTPENETGVYEYLATGTYGGDRGALLNKIGIPDPGSGWQSHHIGYDPETNIMRGQLVNREAHQYPHRGGADEF